MKLLVPLEGRTQFIEQVNSFLPSDIRVQALTKVSKGFNAKAQCTKREYHYLLPSFALIPYTETNAILSAAYAKQGPIQGAGYEGGFVDPNSTRCLNRASLESVRSEFTSYRIPTDQLTLLREALHMYEGTHSYHNFTTGKEASEANSKRFILSFQCSEPFVEESTGIEWLQLSVLGQSFLFNQIRKMVAFAVDIARGKTTMKALEIAFHKDKVRLLQIRFVAHKIY
jgi:tRNA pseudouridine38-40 synthase